jgi:hypothetical protein
MAAGRAFIERYYKHSYSRFALARPSRGDKGAAVQSWPSKTFQIRNGLLRAGAGVASMGVVPFCTGGRGFVNRLTNVGTVLGDIEYVRG